MEFPESETLSLSENTLSGFPVADRCKSWEGFRTLSHEKPASPCSSLASDCINLMLSVEDTGVGIPFEARTRVFTPFWQVGPSISRMHGGTGIGAEHKQAFGGPHGWRNRVFKHTQDRVHLHFHCCFHQRLFQYQ